MSPQPGRRRAKIWPIPLKLPLPIIPIPLRAGDDDAKIDLQAMLSIVYERGAYQLDANYDQDPVPLLSPEQAAWANRSLPR